MSGEPPVERPQLPRTVQLLRTAPRRFLELELEMELELELELELEPGTEAELELRGEEAGDGG